MVVKRQDMTRAGLPEGAFHALVEAAPDIVAVFHGDGTIRYVNAATTAVLGYAAAEVIGRKVQDFFHPDDAARAASRFSEVRDDPETEPRMAVYRLRCRDGGYRHLETLALNRLGDAAIDGIFLIARDVTRRSQAESARLAAEERRRLVAEVARIGIWEWNLEDNSLIADEAVRDIVRQDPGQVWAGPREFLERFHPDDRKQLDAAFRSAMTQGGTCQRVARMPLPDGSLRWIYVYAQRLPGADSPSPWMVGLVMDISEQKRAEEELSRHTELLELASWGADLGLWTWFPAEDRNIIDARSIALLGLSGTHSERPTDECNSRVHPDDLATLKRLEQELVRGERERFDFAYRVQRDDETWHWLLDRGRVSERDASGNALRVSGVTIDIDTEKAKERQLEEQRRQLDLALRASRLGLWDYHADTRSLYVDPRYSEITGLVAEDVRADFAALAGKMHEEDEPRLRAMIRDFLSGQSGKISFEGRLLDKEGRLTWIDIQGFAAERNADGAPLRAIGTIADITDRRRIEQLTRMGELVAGSGSYEYDAGAQRFYWSPGTYRVFELPEDFAPHGGAISELLLPGSREQTLEALRALREEGREFDLEAETLTARGRRIWVRIMGRAESFGERVVHYYGIVQDITQRKRLEAALLETANREQQRLGRELHDGLGQQLTGISLLVQGMAEQVKAANPSLSRHYDRLGSLLSSAIRSTRLLAHGLAPVSAGRGGLEEALKLLAEQSTASYGIPITLELTVGQGIPLREQLGNELYRIAQEAVSNAVRHGKASRVTIRLVAGTADMELEVTDDGCGIPDDVSSSEGMGLRSMAYRAQNLHGRLDVGRRSGGGTRVRVSVPLPRS